MEYRKLGNTDMEVSVLSFGASALGGVFGDISEEDGIKAVHMSVDNGINYLDTAPGYGETKSETVLGKALKTLDRSKYYLATKVGYYADDDYDFSAERVTKEFENSLSRLSVDYVDLIQCHDVEFVDHNQIINETIPALQKLKEQGKVRYIGINGLPLNIYKSILDRVEPGTVDTILSFCHYALNDTSLLEHIPYLKEKQVGIINASPTGMGLLTGRGAPGWHPASDEIKEGCSKAVEYCSAKGIDIVELAIQFCLANKDIATTLVGSAKSANMMSNIEYANGTLDEDKLNEVLEVLKPIHNFNYTRGLEENRDPILQGVAS